MLVSDITIGGLRSYGPEPVSVALKPLTLVFGPNSAGKSSLLSVLPMLQQTAARPDVLSMTGDLVEGGTFRMAIHNHDESLPMTLGFDWQSEAGAKHGGAAEFRWDMDRRQARRTRMFVTNGDDEGWVSGSRPWTGQEFADLALSLSPEFYEVLSRIYFLGPMRARAERTTLLGHSLDNYVGPAGERMAELLYNNHEVIEELNQWCERFDLGYRVVMLTPHSEDIVESVGDFAVLALRDVRRDPPVLVSPRAVGYGIGQLLPVIAQCLLCNQGLVIVEQPEVHLHPKLQAMVGDLFIETVTKNRGQLLVETHSEHLILRILRRVREGLLPTDDLSILYVDQHDDGAAFVRDLAVSEQGDLVHGWPGNFFEERLSEVLAGLGDR